MTTCPAKTSRAGSASIRLVREEGARDGFDGRVLARIRHIFVRAAMGSPTPACVLDHRSVPAVDIERVSRASNRQAPVSENLAELRPKLAMLIIS